MKANYKCSEMEFYTVCKTILVNLRKELGAFAALKAKYTMSFADAVENEIKAAIALPSEKQRTIKHQIPRINLNSRHKECMKKLRALRLYIKDAFNDKEEQRVRLKEAGFNDYRQALQKKWEVLIGSMHKGAQFIANHRTTLLANDNMPAGFEAEFITEADSLKTRVGKFLNMREHTLQGTHEKVLANNTLYKKVMGICLDGQFVFRDNEAKQVQFIFSRVMELVAPRNLARLKFVVKEAGTNLLLAGARVVIKPEGAVGLSTLTDNKGSGVFDGLSAGIYKVSVVLEGFVELVEDVKIRKGVKSFKHWVMEQPQR